MTTCRDNHAKSSTPSWRTYTDGVNAMQSLKWHGSDCQVGRMAVTPTEPNRNCFILPFTATAFNGKLTSAIHGLFPTKCSFSLQFLSVYSWLACLTSDPKAQTSSHDTHFFSNLHPHHGRYQHISASWKNIRRGDDSSHLSELFSVAFLLEAVSAVCKRFSLPNKMAAYEGHWHGGPFSLVL